MKTILVIIVSTVVVLGALFWDASFANAQIGLTQVDTILFRILNTLRTVVLIVFVLAVIVFGWGVVKLILAAGNPTEIAKAKLFIWWGVIGMAILASITGIIVYLQEFFGVSSGGSIKFPTFTL
ncbi:MAG: hypothetical protein A3C07_01250 [Candidatus Sungbacteria bacterium RIFCSPHIGHO2_02_FULL_47_11]|uniref:Uncharacterized protein n=1 Tax=Candidatus Sungbacteria bacterium RIFCSPHIGHO2_02_FULL_47_11 TaxID=1802270 RepID=A0A1G2KM05_9BACT|nr:MAG: hypothetical protein A3C07_01250 [Candidatus Sungbacteria bacterium RIFCSPHIGHO2_02_FULL_47_11]